MKIKVLALDVSSKTGWSYAEIDESGYHLIDSGTLPKQDRPTNFKYPEDYLMWAEMCWTQIWGLIQQIKPDHLVIEETSKGSKDNFSQKFLEFCHYKLATYIVANKIPATYFRTEEWRRICECVMTKEEKLQNKSVKTQRVKGVKVAKNDTGKRIGKIGKKHVNVRRANEIFGLDLILKDEDRADSLLLGYSFFIQQGKK